MLQIIQGQTSKKARAYEWCTGSMTCSFQSEDRMLAIAGLQISHPTLSGLTPTAAMISGVVLSCLILSGTSAHGRKEAWGAHLTTLNRSWRDIAK